MLAGGRSSRMGRDKAQLPFGGSTLLEHTLTTLRHAGFQPAVAGLRAAIDCTAPLVLDTFEDAGPLAGIEAALRSVASAGPAVPQPVLFAPVDLPLLPPRLYRAIWHRAQATGALATVPWHTGAPQPLCAVYHSSLAAGIEQALRQGDRKVMQVIEQLVQATQRDYFSVEVLAAAHGWHTIHRWFSNVNTPAEWEAARFSESESGSGSQRRIQHPASL